MTATSLSKEASAVVEAARALGVRITDRTKNGVVIGLTPPAFYKALFELAEKIEDFDRATGGGVNLEPELARFKTAVAGVFRWMKAQGIDVAEPHRIVSDALEGADTAGPAPPAAAPGGL